MCKVSVIISAYNIDKYIERCINSIVNQTMLDIQIIVVNDGSTDKTLNIINKIAYTDKRIIVIDKRNEGIIEARKSGLEIARGNYILFVDGDDWIEKNTLEKLYDDAIKNNSDIVVYNAFWSDDNKQEPRDIFNIKGDNENYLKMLFLGEIMPAIWAKFIKLEYIKVNNVKFPNRVSYAEDLAMTSSLFIHNPKISFLSDNLYNYYQRLDSITKSRNIKILEMDKAMSFIKDILRKVHIYDNYYEEFEYMIYVHLFENGVFQYLDVENVNNKLYVQYKSKNIDIMKNRYIRNRINNYSLSQKIRIKSYDKKYIYGKLYDKLRKAVRG